VNPRLLVLLGVAAALGLALFAYMQLGRNDDTASVAPSTNTPNTSSTTRPASPTKQQVELLAGLPSMVAGKLRRSNVVVVTVYQGATPDDLRAIANGRKGATDVGAAFLSVNLATESTAKAMAPFIGDATAPQLLVVKRPGRIVTRINGPVDGELVAQAAYNAGARRK
jgi:glucose/arabinose dehydrogenase